MQYSNMVSVRLGSIRPQQKDIIEKCKKLLQFIEMSCYKIFTNQRIIGHEHVMHLFFISGVSETPKAFYIYHERHVSFFFFGGGGGGDQFLGEEIVTKYLLILQFCKFSMFFKSLSKLLHDKLNIRN